MQTLPVFHGRVAGSILAQQPDLSVTLLAAVFAALPSAHLPLRLLPDFFTTAVHARFQYIVATMVAVFVSSFLFWGCIYYAIWK